MPEPDLSSATLLDEITLIVSRAAEAILRIRAGDLSTRAKADASPVTAADEASESIILEGLARVLPGMPVVSEEAFSRTGAPATNADFLMVDPLDGTRELVAGRDEFTVNVAIIHAGRAVTGVLAAPARNIIWRGRVGMGADRLTLAPGAAPGEARERAEIHTRAANANGIAALISRSHLDPATKAFLARLPNVTSTGSGSALKFGRLAEGAADIYPRLSQTGEWDVAAGDAVLTAAGGAVTKADGSPLDYGHAERDFLIPAFIAWGDPALRDRTRC